MPIASRIPRVQTFILVLCSIWMEVRSTSHKLLQVSKVAQRVGILGLWDRRSNTNKKLLVLVQVRERRARGLERGPRRFVRSCRVSRVSSVLVVS